MQIFVNGMIKCCALICWDQGLFGNAVCAGSQGWVTPEAREREGEADKWERGGGEIRMRTWRLICINASWMNISTSWTNYCIASACDQGHGEKPGRKERELCAWLAGGCMGIASCSHPFIMQTSLLLLLIVRGLNKPLTKVYIIGTVMIIFIDLNKNKGDLTPNHCLKGQSTKKYKFFLAPTCWHTNNYTDYLTFHVCFLVK